MDVRQKQLLSYNGSSLPFACVLPVFAHVISAVGHNGLALEQCNGKMKQFFKIIALISTLLFFVIIACEAQTPNKSQADLTQTKEADVGFQCPNGTENEPHPEIKLSVGDVTKKAKELPKPKRSSEAKAARVFGKVVAEVAIDMHSGKVVWARIVSGHPLLQEAVKAVVCQARFYPSLINSATIKIGGTLTYSFRKS